MSSVESCPNSRTEENRNRVYRITGTLYSSGTCPQLVHANHLASGPQATFGATMMDRMVNEVHAVIEELGGESAFGRSLRTATDLEAAIREGFPQEVVEGMIHTTGLTLKELAESLDLSARSLQRRRHHGRLARH